MKKESEKILNNYLEQVKESMEYMSKEEIEDRINTIKAHVMDAIEDQKGELPETVIVRNAIKDLGIAIKPKKTKKDVLIDFLSFGIIGIFVLLLDWIYLYPAFGFNLSIPYFVILLPFAIGLDLWDFKIKPRLTDPRYNLIIGWIFYPILVIELLFLELPDPIPLLGILIVGMLLAIFTVISIAIPGEILEKTCPKCGEILPKKANYCLNCGEEQE